MMCITKEIIIIKKSPTILNVTYTRLNDYINDEFYIKIYRYIFEWKKKNLVNKSVYKILGKGEHVTI